MTACTQSRQVSRPHPRVRGRKTSRSFKVGDKVEIIGYRRLAWGNRKPQKYGFIVNINGAYHLVRPRWWKTSECFELYRGEIRLAARTRLR